MIVYKPIVRPAGSTGQWDTKYNKLFKSKDEAIAYARADINDCFDDYYSNYAPKDKLEIILEELHL